MKFRSVVELGGKTATGFEVPAEVVETLGSTKRPPVRVTINGYTYRSTVAPMGGRYLLPLNADNRTAAGVAAGDEIDVEIEFDDAPREITVPDDLAAALNAEPAARTFFDSMSYSNKRFHVEQITGAKTEATRTRRIEKTVGMMLEGKAR
ncbi:YdeI/OmpD-associated family protein [Aldersonia kunmingensis]|uniref:YdeI/OmpD-associated family protein n=1 Tax=Aldersonia kunmingensis TaxID=408066 RepID=UPI0008351007|nr:YdeI/OmpD-associated family protein [Aldersonia kunmingensis]